MRLFILLTCLTLGAGVALAQRGKADPDYYPVGYPGDTWTGDVTAFDNDQRTLTLTHGSGKNAPTFVAYIPDAPYEWTRDIARSRVLDFPYDKKAKFQLFKYEGIGRAASILPEGADPSGMHRRPTPPDKNRITDFSDFMGRRITVYYTARERKVGDANVKYNDVWRILILSNKKK